MTHHPPTTPVRARHVVAMADRLSESAMDVAVVGESEAAYVDWAPGWEQVTRKYHRRRQALIRLARALDAQATPAAEGYAPASTPDVSAGPHGAWPPATYRADWQPGAVDRCATCSAPVEHLAAHPHGRPGGRRHSGQPGEQ